MMIHLDGGWFNWNPAGNSTESSGIRQTLASATTCTWADFHPIEMEGALNQIWIKCKKNAWSIKKCCLNSIWIML